MTIDHIGIVVAAEDFDKVLSFYLAALAPIGYAEQMRFPVPHGFVVGIGTERKADWWITAGAEKSNTITHVAFSSEDREKVDAFHTAGLTAGGKDNGEPGIRAHYHPNYYGAFLTDPVGNNVEVVCHSPAA